MNPDVKTKWLTALRSGDYKQCKGFLGKAASNTFCCLGVLCEALEIPKTENINGILVYDHTMRMLSMAIMERAGITPDAACQLALKNDIGIPFTEIADWIEVNL